MGFPFPSIRTLLTDRATLAQSSGFDPKSREFRDVILTQVLGKNCKVDPRALASQVLLLTDEVSLTASVQYKSSGEIAGLADPDTIIVNCMDANGPQLAAMGLAFMIRSFGTAGARLLAFFLQGGSTAVYLFCKLFEI